MLVSMSSSASATTRDASVSNRLLSIVRLAFVISAPGCTRCSVSKSLRRHRGHHSLQAQPLLWIVLSGHPLYSASPAIDVFLRDLACVIVFRHVYATVQPTGTRAPRTAFGRTGLFNL